MRYLGLALFREGTTDTMFLGPLIQRVTTDLCLHHASEPVDISDVLEVREPKEAQESSLEARIIEAVRAAAESLDILFIHTDGAGNPMAARTERVDPAVRLIAAENKLSHIHAVAVIPVREMEAWAMADGDALRFALNTTLTDGQLGVPIRSRDVEGIDDPKRVLRTAVRATVPPRRAKKISEENFLGVIGEQVNLGMLRTIPSFVTFEDELKSVLRQMRVIR